MKRTLLALIIVFMGLAMGIKVGEDMSHQYAFTEVGSMWMATSYAHIVVPITVEYIQEKVDTIEKGIKDMGGLSLRSSRSLYTRFNILYKKTNQDFEFVKKKLNHVKSFLTVPNVRPAKRPKRFVSLLVGLGLGGLLAGSVFGIEQEVRIGNIESALGQEEEARRHMVTSIERLTNETAVNRQHIIEIEKAQQQLAKFIQESNALGELFLAFTELEGVINRVDQEIEVLLHAFERVASHKLAYNLIDHDQLSKGLEDIKKKAESSSRKLAVDIPQQLFSCDTSLLFTKNQTAARLLIHVPVVKSSEPFQLYAFNNFPIRQGGLFHQLLIKPDKSILAINRQRTHYVELSIEDLGLCERMNAHYICPHVQEAAKVEKRPSCLKSLFFSDFNGTLRHCPIKVVPARDTCINLGNNEFLLYSTKSYTAFLNCFEDGKWKSSPQQISAVEKFKLPSHCKIDLEEFELQSIAQGENSQPISHFRWPKTINDVIPQIDSKELDQFLEKLQSHHLSPIDPHILRTLHALEQPIHVTDPIHYWALVGGVTFCILSIIVILSCCCLASKKKKKNESVIKFIANEDRLLSSAPRDE